MMPPGRVMSDAVMIHISSASIRLPPTGHILLTQGSGDKYKTQRRSWERKANPPHPISRKQGCRQKDSPEISKQLYSVLERLMTSEKVLIILSCNGMDSISTVLDDMREMRKVTMSDTRMCNMLKVSMNMGAESYSTL